MYHWLQQEHANLALIQAKGVLIELQRLQQKLFSFPLGFEWSKLQSIPSLLCCSEGDLDRAGFSGTYMCAVATLDAMTLSKWLSLLDSCWICCKSLFQQFWIHVCILTTPRALLSVTVCKVAYGSAGFYQCLFPLWIHWLRQRGDTKVHVAGRGREFQVAKCNYICI